MVQTEDQYQFCYRAALEYLSSFDTPYPEWHTAVLELGVWNHCVILRLSMKPLPPYVTFRLNVSIWIWYLKFPPIFPARSVCQRCVLTDFFSVHFSFHIALVPLPLMVLVWNTWKIPMRTRPLTSGMIMSLTSMVSRRMAVWQLAWSPHQKKLKKSLLISWLRLLKWDGL